MVAVAADRKRAFTRVAPRLQGEVEMDLVDQEAGGW